MGKIYYNFKGNETQIIQRQGIWEYTRSSYEEHKEDALAPRAEEGRDKLRKAVGSRK